MIKPQKNATDNPLLTAVREGKLERKLRQYLKSCQPPEDTDPKRAAGKLPNPCGFCVYLGCGLSCMEELQRLLPERYDYLITVFEDELLNAGRSPGQGLASAYLKMRLGYGERDTGEGKPSYQVIFEHDICEDDA